MEHNHRGLVQMIFLSKWVICRFHVNLPGCILVSFTSTWRMVVFSGCSKLVKNHGDRCGKSPKDRVVSDPSHMAIHGLYKWGLLGTY